MKIFLFFAMVLGVTSLVAQNTMDVLIPVDQETNKVKFQEVVDEKGDKYELFKRSI